MKQIYIILLIIGAAILLSCQDDSNSLSSVGYLRLSVAENGQLNTRAYDPKIMHVEIQSEEGEIVKQTDDLDEWEGEVFELPVGDYKIVARSNNYRGEPAFNSPYYYGDTTVQVKVATETTAKVNCKIANVKVTVNYSEEFKTTFAGRDIFVTVGSADEKSSLKSMVFKYGSDAALYFPSNCGPLKATLNVSNPNGGYYTLDETADLAEPKANDHFILNYHLGDTNKGDFMVTVDPTTNAYSYTFYINMTPLDVSASYGTVNAWATFAYLEANNVKADGEVNPSTVKFNYRKKGETEWQEIATAESNGTYTARPTDLEDNMTYEYCLAVNGIQANMAPEFTTEEATELYNGSFDNWHKDDKTWYPNGSGVSFWDTSNPGTTQGMGAIVNVNPTIGVSNPVYAQGGQAAELKTQWAVMKLAAASLYTGEFGELTGGLVPKGATINWGQPFTARPISLKGHFQYAPVSINYVGDNQPANTVTNGDMDICSIFIILSKGTYKVDNTDTNTLLTEEKIKNSEQFIAYGELPIEQCVNTNKEWKAFNIPLKYKNKTDKPTHIIVVCSASKYGDYFTGGDGSIMYLDDFELVYDGEPTIWE